MPIPKLLRRYARNVIAPQKRMRADQLRILPTPAGRVLFLGDSITEQGMWHEWFPDLLTLNRGVGGDTVAEVRSRVPHAVNEPCSISLLVGTNDLGGLGRSVRPRDIAGEFERLVTDLTHRAPHTRLIINSVMPRKASEAGPVRALNARYRLIAENANADYLDLWPALSDRSGGLRSELTADHLHLNGRGYDLWVEALEPLLATP